MRVLLLNQTFHPDVVSSAQHAADLVAALAEAGHEVSVLASDRAYDQPQTHFVSRETWRGVDIRRIGCLALARDAAWKRAVTFASFLLQCSIRMWSGPRPDMVIALTSPPLICVLGALLARARRARFVLWMMDLNPDEAIAAGWLRAGGLAAQVLGWLLRFSLRTSHRVVVLDRFMRERVVAYGIAPEKIVIVPPWPHSNDVAYDAEGRAAFREKHRLTGKFVVMYSGNHSPCHPLDTLLAAARHVASRKDIAFCFVGGGSEFEKVRRFADEHGLNNITCVGYQPRIQLSASLSAADLHAVVMGDPFVGIVHPCKIYNVLTLGIPVLYVGPQPSPITEIAAQAEGCGFSSARHGDSAGVALHIVRAADAGPASHQAGPALLRDFSQRALITRFLSVLPTPEPSTMSGIQPRAEQA